MYFITIFNLLEWMKKNGYDTSFYDDAEYQDDFWIFFTSSGMAMYGLQMALMSGFL